MPRFQVEGQGVSTMDNNQNSNQGQSLQSQPRMQQNNFPNQQKEFSLLSRISSEEDLEKQRQEELRKQQELERIQAEQNKPINPAQTSPYKNERPQFGQSLLSPENALYQEAEADDGRVSPFSDEYTERQTAEENEEEDEIEAIKTNRLIFYIGFLGIFYIVALCIGYHNTSFVGNAPQLVSVEQREADTYLGRIDEYILALQNLHSESLENTESYTQSIMGASELVSELKKSNEKIDKMKEEISDIAPPDKFEHFQSQLLELYSQQAALNSVIGNYASQKTEDAFNVVEAMNEKYEESNDNFLVTYNHMFIK